MRRLTIFFLALALALFAARTVNPPNAAPPVDAKLETIRYADLAKLVKNLKGRVVLVDFWASYCAPCKQELPKLVALHRKHSKDGLTLITVALDDPADSDATQQVRSFLQMQRADCLNYQLTDSPETWTQKLKINGPPCIFVFDAQGRLQDVYRGAVGAEEIEASVAQAMQTLPKP
jgi:thiol-disulfide isomerase/thioredoxin